MREVSTLPGRIRLKTNELYKDKALCKYINLYVENLYGVNHCSINGNTSSILIVYDQEKTNSGLLKSNLEKALYSASNNCREDLTRLDYYYTALKDRDKARNKFIRYGLLYILFKAKQFYFGKFSLSRNLKILQVASAVTIVGGYPLLKNIYRRFTSKVPTDSDLLLKLTAISFTIMRESTKGVMVLVLKALSDYIKLSADVESQRMLNNSLSTTSNMVWLTNTKNEEILVPITSIKKGDFINVHEGEVIPVEGKVTKGTAYVNSLFYTGQPIVSQLRRNYKVHEGLIVLSGFIKIKVIDLPISYSKENPIVDKLMISKSVKKHQNKVIPIAFGAATLSYMLTGNFLNSLATILVLTPSGSGTALSTGMNNYISLLKKYNIFIKNPNTIENVINTKNIVFDKTGTLTHGEMKIINFETFNDKYSKEDLIKICAACEVNTYHPISVTLQNASNNDFDIQKVDSSVLIPSQGIKAEYDDHKILMGNLNFLKKSNVNVSNIISKYEEYEKNLYTPVLISIDNEVCGLLALQDIIRDDSFDLIDKLKYRGFNNLTLLTGDTYTKAKDTAEKLGINTIYSECTYEEKSNIISEYKENGIVMMIGDGVNDIEAMRKADVSVSFANSACDRTKLNSDCILFENDISNLSDFISLSQKTYIKINQSVNYSRLYNFALAPFAVLGYFTPFTAKSLNTLNSLIVLILNERIKLLTPGKIYKPTDHKF